MDSQVKAISELTAVKGFVNGMGPAMRSVMAVVADVARTDIPVLVMGESGTGKEVYARLIHQLSAFPSATLKKVNCAALTAETLQKQLLGTSEQSDGNSDPQSTTLFLDEIDELDLVTQRALLTILPDGEPKNSTQELSTRLITSTSRDLGQDVECGRFRRELYFRISGVCLRLPPLRERKEDIPKLLDFFLARHAAHQRKPVPVVNPEILDRMMSHAWPGNIRELENIAKRMIALENGLMALGELRVSQLNGVRESNGALPPSLKVAARAVSQRTEKELILKALERTRWNRKRAAQELQISYKSLLYKLKQICIASSDSAKES
jgi:two-component system response regulator AtoC